MPERSINSKRRHAFQVRKRAFEIWQKLGYYPWRKPREEKSREGRKKSSGDFYKGAFDSIPFLNEDAKRTFTHLLLRPGYMIRDYINGNHERYLAPLTALIVFYAFFALVWSVMQPVQHKEDVSFDDVIRIENTIADAAGDAAETADAGKTAETADAGKTADEYLRYENGSFSFSFDTEDEEFINSNGLIQTSLRLFNRGYIYLTLDQHPEQVRTRGESALAALESTLRSQGIPLFLSQFFLLWLALSYVLRRYNLGMSATAAGAAFILCQFSFFMLFAVLLTFGKSKSLGVLLMLTLITIDLHQWIGVSVKKSVRLAIRTGIMYAVIAVAFIFLVSVAVMGIAYLKTA